MLPYCEFHSTYFVFFSYTGIAFKKVIAETKVIKFLWLTCFGNQIKCLPFSDFRYSLFKELIRFFKISNPYRFSITTAFLPLENCFYVHLCTKVCTNKIALIKKNWQ